MKRCVKMWKNRELELKFLIKMEIMLKAIKGISKD